MNVKYMSNNITVYRPDNSIKKGYRSLFREMIEELRSSKWLTWQLFRRDFKAIYQQSILGILWPLLAPAITVGTFIYLNLAGIFNVGDLTVPYPIYALFGMALWGLFSGGLSGSTGSLAGAGGLIKKISFPREAIIISKFGGALVSFLIQIVAISLLFIWYGIVPSWTVIFFPFTLIPILLLALGLGFILSIFNVAVRDIGKVIGVGLTFLMFVTPVLYVKPTSGIAAVFSRYNPLYYLITVPRDLVFFGGTAELTGYMCVVLLTIIVFLLGWMAFHLTETKIAERI